MVVAIWLWSGSCPVEFLFSNLCISGMDNYTRHEIFGSVRVYFISCCCLGSILFIVLWDIAHATCLQLLAYKVPAWDRVEDQYVSQVS